MSDFLEGDSVVGNRVPVLDVMIDVVTMEQAVAAAEDFISQGTPHLVVTPNAEIVMMAQKDQELKDILRQADLVVPDGAGVVWAARHHGNYLPERVAGYDLVQNLLAKAAVKGYRVYMFGGAPGIVDKAKVFAEEQYTGVEIVGTHHGYFSAGEEEEIIGAIRRSQPHILLVAFGVPKQEKWLAKYMQELNVPVAIGVGGTFDVMAGTVKRAPLWMQRARLEWLYRLLQDPKRAMRMLALPRFVLKVLANKR